MHLLNDSLVGNDKLVVLSFRAVARNLSALEKQVLLKIPPIVGMTNDVNFVISSRSETCEASMNGVNKSFSGGRTIHELKDSPIVGMTNDVNFVISSRSETCETSMNGVNKSFSTILLYRCSKTAIQD